MVTKEGTKVGNVDVGAVGTMEGLVVVGEDVRVFVGVVVGLIVGVMVGIIDGTLVGDMVGEVVGMTVGPDDGSMVGTTVGIEVGTLVGAVDGHIVGVGELGITVGIDEGAVVGVLVGELLGLIEGVSVGVIEGTTLVVGLLVGVVLGAAVAAYSPRMQLEPPLSEINTRPSDWIGDSHTERCARRHKSGRICTCSCNRLHKTRKCTYHSYSIIVLVTVKYISNSIAPNTSRIVHSSGSGWYILSQCNSQTASNKHINDFIISYDSKPLPTHITYKYFAGTINKQAKCSIDCG